MQGVLSQVPPQVFTSQFPAPLSTGSGVGTLTRLGAQAQSPQTTLSLTTGCVLSVAAGTRPQLWINKEWQQRGLPAFMASASSEWMEMGDSILGGSERSAPSCATCLPH